MIHNVLKVSCTYNNKDSSRIPMKFNQPEYKKKLYHKIQNIKALDRAIFNIHLKMNGMFDKEYVNINTEQNKQEAVDELQKLNYLKTQWEKELMYMYLEEE